MQKMQTEKSENNIKSLKFRFTVTQGSHDMITGEPD